MGVLTDVYVADTGEAFDLKRELPGNDQWEGIDLKGHSQITLAELWNVLDPSIDPITAMEQFELLTGDDEEGPWVIKLPDQLVKCLCEADTSSLDSIHEKWINSEDMREMVMDDEDAKAVKEQLRSLRSLAQEATDTQKSLLMWVCL